MRLTTMAAVCRLLFVCFFCTLWGGQVIAGNVVSKVDDRATAALKKAQDVEEVMRWVQNNLTVAEWYANNMSSYLDGSDFEDAKIKQNASCLVEAVTNAKNEAEKAKTALGEMEKEAASDEELKTLVNTAVKDVGKLVDEVKKVDTAAENIKTGAGTVQATDKAKYKNTVEAIKQPLTDAKDAANKAMTALKDVAKKALKTQNQPPDKTQKDPGTLSGDKGRGQGDGEQDKDNSQTNATDSTRQNPPGSNKLSNDGLNKNGTTSSSTQDDNTPDGAHGGAIATCTAAPLLLLLTAVAYAAVC